MKKFLATLLLAGSLFMPTVNAEVKTYEASDEYVMSEFETIDIAKQRARQKAERAAQEKAGVYISSYSETKDMELVTDEIVSIACGIMSVIDVKYDTETLPDVNGFVIRATVKANIETDDVNKWLEKSAMEKSAIVTRNKELQKTVDEQDATINKLKAQIKRLTAEGKLSGKREREKITKEFAAEDKVFQANLKLEEAQKNFYNKDFAASIKSCDEAIKIYPTARAYSWRAGANAVMQNFKQAIADGTKAIELDPTDAEAYNSRGGAYGSLQNYQQAVADFTKAIELKPDYAMAYSNRGSTLRILGDVQQGLQDLNKAVELNPKIDIAYFNRAFCYIALNNAANAIADLDKAIELNPNFAMAYYARGHCYQAVGNFQQAQADIAKAHALGYNG